MAVRVVVCGVKVFSLYGPEPTGVRLGQVSGFSTFSQTCLGTTKVVMILFWLTNCDSLKVRTTFSPSTAIPSYGMPLPLSAGCFFSSSKVNATSAAVSGLPSAHLARLSSVKVSLVKFDSQSQAVASHGSALSVGRIWFVIASGS
ncbi:hypothetical protein OKW18_002090 [Streptomyces pratensis]|nr:hypothetical protein [Streptomyces pratensis]